MNLDKLIVSPSPHVKSGMTTTKIMMHVLIALVPAIIASAMIFGGRALMLIGFCTMTAILWEKIIRKIMKREDTTGDLSAAVTGVILALNLPVTLPFWMALIGTFFAIVVVKQLFGGLGCNFANPAIVGRIVLFISFPAAMANWVKPYYYTFEDGVDTISKATPLASKCANLQDLFLGKVSGCLGETCALALIIGGIYLVVMRIITPTAPVAFIGTVALFSFFAGEEPLYQVLSGGLMLGAIFMATDYVTTPVTQLGKLIFGIGCGIITCVIRFYASYPEGVSFSILLMNIITPYIDMATRTRPLGAKKAEKVAKEAK